jgi:hypothetical protein
MPGAICTRYLASSVIPLRNQEINEREAHFASQGDWRRPGWLHFSGLCNVIPRGVAGELIVLIFRIRELGNP